MQIVNKSIARKAVSELMPLLKGHMESCECVKVEELRAHKDMAKFTDADFFEAADQLGYEVVF